MKIDGVDVSKCKYLHENVICGKFCTHCEQNPNCDYKQLQQKEKELKEQLQFKNQFKDYAHRYKQAIDKIKGKCQKYDAEVGDTIIANPIQDLYDILQIINEVKEC